MSNTYSSELSLDLSEKEIRAFKERVRYYRNKGLSEDDAFNKANIRLLVNGQNSFNDGSFYKKKGETSCHPSSEDIEKVKSGTLNYQQKTWPEILNSRIHSIPNKCIEKEEIARTETLPKWSDYLLSIIRNPAFGLQVTIATGILVLLIVLQVDSYKSASIDNALSLSVATEISLITLGLIKLGSSLDYLRNFLIAALIIYAVGSQSIGLLYESNKKQQEIVSQDPKLELLRQELSAAIMAKTNAAKYGNHAEVKRQGKEILALKKSIKDLECRRYESGTVLLEQVKTWGLIVIRTILMMIIVPDIQCVL